MHDWVDYAFQLLKIEHNSKLEDTIIETASKVEESFTHKLNLLHCEVNYTIEVKLAAAD